MILLLFFETELPVGGQKIFIHLKEEEVMERLVMHTPLSIL